MFGVQGAASVETVSRQELVATLGSAPTDEAISSAALTCGDPSVGIKVRTEHVTRVSAAAYAGALLTVGLQGASATVAAPSGKPVSGETGLLGLLKSVPTCLGHPVDPHRVELAYQQLDLLSSLAGNAGDLAAASELLLRMLDEVLRGTPPDVVVEREAVGLDDSQRAAAIALLDQLRGLNYGPYGGGFRAAIVDGSYGILPPG